ncbi:hypothetical protein GF325_09245 [Candidatus Bathyarchaeota archaeon]|nr:hypothetical protein [Candidatus Bathyarchaeota archaeon]
MKEESTPFSLGRGSSIRGFAGITTPVLYIYSFIADLGLNRFELISVVLMFTPVFLMGILVLAYWLYLQYFPHQKEKFTHRGKFKVLDLKMELR